MSEQTQLVTAVIVTAAIVTMFYCCYDHHILFHSLIRFDGGFNEWGDRAEHQVHLQ